MDFFAHQSRYRRRSRWLVLLFVLAVLAVVAFVDLVVAWCCHAFAWFLFSMDAHVSWSTIATLSIVLLVLIALASIYRIATLRGGGCVVAMGMGAVPVPAGTTDPVWRRLRNVVEEIAIASGVPVFNIFVMEHEQGINAFAAGYTVSDAAICVSQGCLDKLNRDELQGVVAHELSHVVNGDMRLNIRLMGLLYGILGMGVIGHRMLDAGMNFAGRRGSAMDNSMPALLVMGGMAAVCFGAAGSFCGRLVQAAVARTRESLADASAVQFTRQTLGIAGALKKIAALREGSWIRSPGKREVAHMLFGNPGRLTGWFATHPPLRKRLQALGVRWNDGEIAALARAWQHPPLAADPSSSSASVSGFAPAGVASRGDGRDRSPVAGSGAVTVKVSRRISHHVGHPQARDFDLAASLRARLPATLRQAAEDPYRAEALLPALVLDRRAEVFHKQKAIIEQAMGATVTAAVEQARHALAGLDPMLRLPLAALAFPTLRRRPRPQLQRLLVTLDALVHADDRMDLHEYCLMRLLGRQLHDLLDPAAGFRPGTRRLWGCRERFASLCAMLTWHGNHDDEAARRAFLRAMAHTLPGWTVDPVVPTDWQAGMDEALASLDRLRAFDKQLVIDGLAIAVSDDGIVTVAESELLRMICAMLNCPLPPLHARPLPAT